MTESCSYTFRPSTRADATDRGTASESEGALAEPWDCPHDAHDAADTCLFHLSPDRRDELGIADETVRDAFLDAVAAGDRARRSFVGAEFDTLDLSARHVDSGDRFVLDLRHATVDTLDLSRAVVGQPIRFDHAEIGEIEARNADFQGSVTLRGADIADGADFGSAEFEGTVDRDDVTFGGPARFRSATLDERTTFVETDFEEAVFTEVTFDGDVAFRGARFAGEAHLAGTEFAGGANVEADDADFSDATFESAVSFEMARFRAGTYSGTTFGDEVTFERAVFRRDTTFADAAFEGSLSLTRGTFRGNVTFERAAFDAETTFEEVEFGGDAVFAGATFDAPVSFAGGEFRGGSNLLVDDADFSDTVFASGADFRTTRFRYAGFEDARLGSDATFSGATFVRGATFEEAAFDAAAEFADCRFEGTADFDAASVGDSFVFEETVCTDDATFAGLQVAGDASFRGTEFRGGANVVVDDADFSNARVGGTLDCEHAFFRWARFDGAQFGGPVRLPDARFERGCSFGDATVDGELDCYRARFVGDADFEDATLSTVRFDETVFDDDASFAGTRIRGNASFRGVEFRGGANVVVDDADFSGTVFEADATFRDAVFRYGRFDAAAFHAPPTFDESTFRKGASFDATELPASASFRNAYVERGLDFAPTPRDESALVDMSSADLQHGELARSTDGGVYYDLTGATLGTVTLTTAGPDGQTDAAADGGSDAEGTEESADVALFDHFLFNDTEFEDFDFSRHRGYLERNRWVIHGFDGAFTPAAATDGGHALTPRDLEATYLKAKNGAAAVGDNKANSEFFRKEMAYRRKQYERVLRGETNGGALSKPRALAKWCINAFFDATCGYGERPLRVVFVSLMLIGLFAVPYALLGVDIADSNVADPFVYSLQSFTSLVLDPPKGANALVNTMTAFEGFVGGFFIALFVFSLTRSLHR